MKRSSAPMVEFAERHELSFSQLKMIFVLANAEVAMPIGHVAETVGLSLPAAGRAVDGLVRQKLATRTEDPDDRRVKLVQITDKGTEGIQVIAEHRAAGLRELLEGLPEDELAAMASAVASLRKSVDQTTNREEGRS